MYPKKNVITHILMKKLLFNTVANIYFFNTIKYLELYLFNLFAKNELCHKTNITS